MIGQKLRERREANDLVQRQVAAVLEVDSAYISKIEWNEKPVSRGHLKKLFMLWNIYEEEPYAFGLASKVYDVVKGEEVAFQGIHTAENHAPNAINRKVRGR